MRGIERYRSSDNNDQKSCENTIQTTNALYREYMKYKKNSDSANLVNLSVHKPTVSRVLATQSSRRGILTKCGFETIQSKPENHTMQNFR